jgi:hypothetical protein
MMYYLLVSFLIATFGAAIALYGIAGAAALIETAALTEKLLFITFALFVAFPLLGGRKFQRRRT